MSTILLIPGMWRSGGLQILADSLAARGHAVVPVALPGSDAVEKGRISWSEAISAVEQAVDALPASEIPHLIGESTGGLLALDVAARRTTGPVVLLNTPAPLRGWRSPLFFLYAAARQAFGHAYRGEFREMFFSKAGASPALGVPVLIWSSARDLLVSGASTRDLLALYPQADYQRCEAPVSISSEKCACDLGDWIEALVEENAPVRETPILAAHGRGLHHGAPALARRTPVRIPFTPVRSLHRRSSQAPGRRDRSAGAVAD
jgi:pimeloyl-ACP methyl ester carboxylesterase